MILLNADEYQLVIAGVWHQIGNRTHQGFDADGLREVAVHAGGKAAFTVGRAAQSGSIVTNHDHAGAAVRPAITIVISPVPFTTNNSSATSKPPTTEAGMLRRRNEANCATIRSPAITTGAASARTANAGSVRERGSTHPA